MACTDSISAPGPGLYMPQVDELLVLEVPCLDLLAQPGPDLVQHAAAGFV